MDNKPKTIDEYLDKVETQRRAELERIRALVKELVPSAEETISYNMPTLKYKNRALVFFTASKKHMSFMPSSWAINWCSGCQRVIGCCGKHQHKTRNNPPPQPRGL